MICSVLICLVISLFVNCTKSEGHLSSLFLDVTSIVYPETVWVIRYKTSRWTKRFCREHMPRYDGCVSTCPVMVTDMLVQRSCTCWPVLSHSAGESESRGETQLWCIAANLLLKISLRFFGENISSAKPRSASCCHQHSGVPMPEGFIWSHGKFSISDYVGSEA